METLVYNNSGIKSQMAANINSELEKAGFKNLGITERPNLVVLKRTKMPAVLVEASFINNDKDNETFDKNFNQIANGIADGILKTLGIKPKTNNTTAQAASGEVPSVKSDSAKSAEIMPTACEKKPAPPAKPACNCDDDLSPEPLYRVQVGAYRNKNNADRMLNSLLIEGFPAFIIYENDYYKVQVGAFRQLSNAIKMEQKLRKFRYNTYIVYS